VGPEIEVVCGKERTLTKQILSWNETPAIGATQSEIDTPCLVVDLEAVEQNIATLMKRFQRFP
jgi:diaminopimelate decarboxylase